METPTQSSYRPHNPGHDYYNPGIYLITLVVRNRSQNQNMFGHFNKDPKSPKVINNPTGQAVLNCWNLIPQFQQQHSRKVKVHRATCMPDHFHGVIEVLERMDVSLGEVICGFKIGCTKAWRSLQQQPSTAIASPLDSLHETGKPYMVFPTCTPQELHNMSKKQRAAYYSLHPEANQPLWDDNYDDTICLSDPITGQYSARHFNAMLKYIDDNPRRAIIRRHCPDFFNRCLHITIAGRDYAAFGNPFLLRWPRKIQIFCHRQARFHQLTPTEAHHLDLSPTTNPNTKTPIPYIKTQSFINDCTLWKQQVIEGATVLVTPGISPGEHYIKNRCLQAGYPLIHIQKEPIGRLWKPELTRFEACANGTLLILAPWSPDTLGEVNGIPSNTDYSIFHNLNTLAQEICEFEGEAMICG